MTTKSKLKKTMKQSFIPTMEEMGFSYNLKECLFYRKHNNIYNIVMPDLTSGGNISFFTFFWVKEFEPGYEMNDFPNDIGIFTEKSSLRKDVGGFTWSGETDDDVEMCLAEVLRSINDRVLPWFNSIDNREKLVEVLDVRVKERNNFSEFKNRVLSSRR